MELTHDELLAEIRLYGCECCHNPHINALRTVVELHKPVFNGVNTLCYCGAEGFYPCPTIQAITKELE